jgi:catechol 2,3-dioxygenase-like lactoylglutathione lyase family enzyme
MGPHGIPDAARYYLGTTPRSTTDSSGVVDHIAFLATDPEGFRKRFDRLGIKARNRFFPQFNLYQSFVTDPNGLLIELNFHGIDAEPDWGESEDYAQMARAAPAAK